MLPMTSTRFAISSSLFCFATSSILPIFNGLQALRPRSQLEVSATVDAHMQDLADNITSLFQSYQPNGFELRTRTLPLIARAGEGSEPVPTAEVVIIENDPPPDGAVWDESIANDEDAIAAVKTAWTEALRLAQTANAGLETLQNNLDAANHGSDLDKKKDFIAKQSPPFAQQFGSDPDIISDVKEVFQRIVDRVGNQDAPGRDGKVLRLAKGYDIKLGSDGRKKACAAKKAKVLVYAAAYPGRPLDQNDNDLQAKYLLEDDMIIFCNGFFQHLKDRNQLQTDWDVAAAHPDLSKLRTPGQTMLHEWTHLDWIKATNQNPPPLDTYDFVNTAVLMRDNGAEQALNNADSYAVFGSYHTYNQESWAPIDNRDGFGCRDIWPRKENAPDEFFPEKPGKDTWP